MRPRDTDVYDVGDEIRCTTFLWETHPEGGGGGGGGRGGGGEGGRGEGGGGRFIQS